MNEVSEPKLTKSQKAEQIVEKVFEEIKAGPSKLNELNAIDANIDKLIKKSLEIRKVDGVDKFFNDLKIFESTNGMSDLSSYQFIFTNLLKLKNDILQEVQQPYIKNLDKIKKEFEDNKKLASKFHDNRVAYVTMVSLISSLNSYYSALDVTNLSLNNLLKKIKVDKTVIPKQFDPNTIQDGEKKFVAYVKLFNKVIKYIKIIEGDLDDIKIGSNTGQINPKFYDQIT